MGTLLELGPQGSLVSHHMVHICGSVTPQTYGRMEKKEGRDAVGYRVYRGIIHLFRCQFSLEERTYVPMNILVIGLNHKTASVEIRERLAFNGPKLEEGLLAIRQLKGVNEAALLSTCNRVEIY